MMRKLLFALMALAPAALSAQTFDFDLTKPQPVFNEQDGYGYDVQPAPNMKKPTAAPFYFSVRVPDGNYLVRVTMGGVKGGNTTVRAEGRRLMMDQVLTPKKKDVQTVEFVVNKRSTLIEGDKRVKIKDRERGYLAWDDKLTLEFNGPQPAVRTIHIEPAAVPTVYLCGNSTVVDQNYEPWASWGQMITRFFGPQVAISNHAESGLTARTFIGGNRLEKILTMMRPGDYVVCEFGHNDEKEHRPGDGAWYHYVYNLKIFIDKVRAAGGHIIFCTPTQRRAWQDDNIHLKDTHGDFPAAMRSVAEREGVPVIDLNGMTRTFFETLGFEGSKKALVHYPANTYPGQDKALADNTHFNPYGAYEVAKMVVTGMRRLQLPVVDGLRPDWQDYDPSSPDSPETFVWYDAKALDTQKPDGN